LPGSNQTRRPHIFYCLSSKK